MKIKTLLILVLTFVIVFSFSGCKKVTEITDTEITKDEMLVEYYSYKESVYKQLENQIKDLKKMKEVNFEIIDNETKDWFMTLEINKDVFKLHATHYVTIQAQKNTITSNDYEKIMNEIKIQEKVANDVYSTILHNKQYLYQSELLSDSTYFQYTVDGILEPTEEDFNNPNNYFYLYVHINGEKTRDYVSCSNDFFNSIEESIKELLLTEHFKDKKNITVIVYVAGCGEIKYSVVNNSPFSEIIRTQDGREKLQILEDKNKSELEKMTEEERKEFLKDKEAEIKSAIESSIKNNNASEIIN